MKKSIKSVLVLTLVLAICLSAALPGLAVTNTEGITFSAELNKSAVVVDGENVTVEMTVAMSAAHLCDSIQFSLISDIPGFSATLKTDSLGDSIFDEETKALSWMSSTDKSVQTLGVFEITIPADTVAKDYTIGIQNAQLSANMAYWEEEGSASATITVSAPVSYTATFAPGEGGEGTAPENITGSTITLPANTFTNSDTTKSFVGWKSSTDDQVYPAGAKVTLTADTTFTAQWASYAIELQPNVTEVGLGGTVDIKIVSTGNAFHAYDITVTYDTTKFAYEGASGSVNIKKFDQTIGADGVVATLSFTALDSFTEKVTGEFGFSKSLVAQSVAALSTDAVAASTKGTTVDIVPKYIVRFFGKDGAPQIGSDIEVAYGAKLAAADVPAAPGVDHYTFAGWKSNATGTPVYQTADEIAALEVKAAVDYTAQYDPEQYDVTKGDGIEGPDKATYDVPYEGTVTGAPDDNYDYTVTVEFPNGTTKEYPVDETGKFVITDEITGPIKITLNKTLKGVVVKTYMDYVGGHTLIVAYGINANGYTYSGNAMYRTAYYDGDTVTDKPADAKAFAWIIKGGIDDAGALAKLGVASTAAAEVAAGNDVNNTGTTDIADVQAVADCYNVKGDLAVYMAVYLRADRDASHVVDTTDANTVLAALA